MILTAEIPKKFHILIYFTCNAALVAVSNTSRTPSLLLAEHSRYANALIFSAIARPSSGFTGSCFIFPSSLIVLGSFRKSWRHKKKKTIRKHSLCTTWRHSYKYKTLSNTITNNATVQVQTITTHFRVFVTITVDANITADRQFAFCDSSKSHQNVTHLCEYQRHSCKSSTQNHKPFHEQTWHRFIRESS